MDELNAEDIVSGDKHVGALFKKAKNKNKLNVICTHDY